jgi:hypothetical protein
VISGSFLICQQIIRVRLIVFNATFNNISVISWWSVVLVEETRVPGVKSQVTDNLYQSRCLRLYCKSGALVFSVFRSLFCLMMALCTVVFSVFRSLFCLMIALCTVVFSVSRSLFYCTQGHHQTK